jgi:hypothetical protein
MGTGQRAYFVKRGRRKRRRECEALYRLIFMPGL